MRLITSGENSRKRLKAIALCSAYSTKRPTNGGRQDFIASRPKLCRSSRHCGSPGKQKQASNKFIRSPGSTVSFLNSWTPIRRDRPMLLPHALDVPRVVIQRTLSDVRLIESQGFLTPAPAL